MKYVTKEEAESYVHDGHIEDGCPVFRCRLTRTVIALHNALEEQGKPVPWDEDAPQGGAPSACNNFTPDKDGYCQNCSWVEKHHST